MSARNANRQLAFIPEVTFGVTPGTPQTQLIEFVEFDGELNSEQLSDPSITPHRQVSFSRRGNVGVEGTLTVVMCPDNYDFALEGVMCSTFATGVLKFGNTQRSHAFEEGFTDLAQYRTFNGVTFNTFSMEVTPTGLIQASFGFMGSGTSAFTGTSIDTTPTPLVVKDKFFHEGGTITEGGSAAGFITSIAFEVTNNLTGNYALGSSSYRSMTLGKIQVTGKVTALFESVALYNKYKNSTDSTLSETFVAGAESLQFSFPKVKYTAGRLIRSDNGPVLCELDFEAVYDTTAASSMVITRV